MNKDLFDKIIKPKDVLTAEEIKKLPTWVKDDLENAKIVGKSQKVIEVSNGTTYKNFKFLKK